MAKGVFSAGSSSSSSSPNHKGDSTSRPQLHTPLPRVRASSSADSSDAYDSTSTTTTNSQTTLLYPPITTTNTNNHTNGSLSPRRTRFNSRDMARTYSGLYHGGDDHSHLLPLECERSKQALLTKVSFMIFWSTYVTLLLVVQAVAMNVVTHSWTLTNAVHLLVTLAYIHWFKGSPYLLDEQGELNAMTIWEQLEATPESSLYMRRTLLIVPTVLAYAACVTADFEVRVSAINISLWCISVLAKLPFMNGVRLFGINRTAGIDDDDEVDGGDTTTTTTTTNAIGGTAATTTATASRAKKVE